MSDVLEALETLARMAGEKADAYPAHIEEEIHNEIVRARGVIEAALMTPRLLLTETGCKVTVRRQKAEDTAPPAGVYLRLSVEDMGHSVGVAEVRLNEIEAVELATCLLEVLR